MTTLYTLPEGELSAGFLLSTALVLNEGTMDVDNAQLMNLDNFGQLHCNGLLQLGTGSFLGNVILRPSSMTTIAELLNFGSATFQTNSLTLLAKLDNRGGLNGHGTICISDSSINHGTVLGSLRICDATSTDGAGGFDINTGTIAPTVTYCGNSSCAWTSMSDEASVPAIQINPNPTVDLLHIQLGSSSPEVDRIEVRDLDGRLVQQLTGPFAERIVLHRNGLVAGTYLLRVLWMSGETMAIQPVIFTD
ncbi:MAG: T9SS type A sorting domain-containing protein [Flavobacteriales bacterium]|nr:T9SS type A sorting domain-containing protein [Flavobacteriales bacterium]